MTGLLAKTREAQSFTAANMNSGNTENRSQQTNGDKSKKNTETAFDESRLQLMPTQMSSAQFVKLLVEMLFGVDCVVSDGSYFWTTLRMKPRYMRVPKNTRNAILKACGFVHNGDRPDIDGATRFVREHLPRVRGNTYDTDNPFLVGAEEVSVVMLLIELMRNEHCEPDPLFILDEQPSNLSRKKQRKKQERQDKWDALVESGDLDPLFKLGKLGEDFALFLFWRLQIVLTPPEIIVAMARELHYLIELSERSAHLIGEDDFLAIAGVVCPDWSYNNGFTFEALGNGISFVAGNVFRGFVLLWQFFREHKLDHLVRFVSVMANSEAYDETNQQTVGLTEYGFMKRLEQSNQEFLKALPAEMRSRVDVVMLTEVLDVTTWDRLFKQAVSRARRNNWDDSKLPVDEKSPVESFKRRIGIYCDWIRVASSRFNTNLKELFQKVTWADLVHAVEQGENASLWMNFKLEDEDIHWMIAMVSLFEWHDWQDIVLAAEEGVGSPFWSHSDFDFSDEDIQWIILSLEKFFNQIAEHAVAAWVLGGRYEHLMIFQGETPWMALWWQVMAFVTVCVVYLRQQAEGVWHKYTDPEYHPHKK